MDDRIRQCYMVSQSVDVYEDLFRSIKEDSSVLNPTLIKKVLTFPWDSAPEEAIAFVSKFAAETASIGSFSSLVCKLLSEGLAKSSTMYGTQPSVTEPHPQLIAQRRISQVICDLISVNPALLESHMWPSLVSNFPHKSRPTDTLSVYACSLLSIGERLDALEAAFCAVFATFLELDGEARNPSEGVWQKLLVLLTRILEWLDNPIEPGRLERSMPALLSCYEQTLLRAHRPLLVQSLFFHVFERSREFAESFIQRNLRFLYHPQSDPFRFKTSLKFLASYLLRSRRLTEGVCVQTCKFMSELVVGNIGGKNIPTAAGCVLTVILGSASRWRNRRLAWIGNFAECCSLINGTELAKVIDQIICNQLVNCCRTLIGPVLSKTISELNNFRSVDLKSETSQMPFDNLDFTEFTKGMYRDIIEPIPEKDNRQYAKTVMEYDYSDDDESMIGSFVDFRYLSDIDEEEVMTVEEFDCFEDYPIFDLHCEDLENESEENPVLNRIIRSQLFRKPLFP